MDIRGRRILLLGGWGLVGTAIIRKLVEHDPESIIILSLFEKEAREACERFTPLAPKVRFIPEWGNIFVNETLKDLSREEILENPENRALLIKDVMEALDDKTMASSYLNQVITRHKPNIIIDSVNSATALAYQDVYNAYYNLKREFDTVRSEDKLTSDFVNEVDKMLMTLYIPQIIRHIQILHASMLNNNTGIYLKIGTTGTGGMGLNIPYTHSEERPSRVLLSKTSLAGAQTMLLFLMARTPDGPIVKEIKPAATIAWKGIGYGEIKKHGNAIQMYDCEPEKAVKLEDVYKIAGENNWTELEKTLKSVYVDTGENGIFSAGEFETITAAGQMEFVTPEEIAENVILEIVGDSTGSNVISALENSVMGPTYRAGYMRHYALSEMERLQKEYNVDSVAFEILGPPRLSKLLYEIQILKRIGQTLPGILQYSPGELAEMSEQEVIGHQNLRSEIISIGVPILLRDGKHLLRGAVVKIPPPQGRDSIEISERDIDDWARAGWVDLRRQNMELWRNRIQQIVNYVAGLDPHDTSSRYHHGLPYWDIEGPINIGKVLAWIFIHEDKGLRIKR